MYRTLIKIQTLISKIREQVHVLGQSLLRYFRKDQGDKTVASMAQNPAEIALKLASEYQS